jgi:IgGFc binding protein
MQRSRSVALGISFAVWTLALTARAQECPAGKTCFYVPPAMVHAGGNDTYGNELWFSIPSGSADGTYSVDGAAGVAFSVTAAAALKVDLAQTSMSSAVNVPETRGVFVVSSREDLLVEHKELRLVTSDGYTEGYSVTVPRHKVALGTRFRLGGFRMTSPSPGSVAPTAQWAMLTAPAGATVTLTAPPGATLPYWTGSTTKTHAVTLAAGQSVSVSANGPLDGALAVASAPVAAASGGRGWLSPCGDNGADALVPASQYGTEWAVRLPSGSPTEAGVAVIADVNATEVRIDGVVVKTLNAGETHFFRPTSPARVETSAPALVWMNGSLQSCELDTGLIPPLELPAAPLTIAFNASFGAEVAVVIGTSAAAGLQLDGASVTPTSSTALPGRADVTVVVFNVAAGLHTVSATSGFQLMAAYAGAGAGVLAYFGPFVACTTTASCPDIGPCVVEQCVAGGCSATPVPAGTRGECAAGLVCNAAGACVTPPDAGPNDGGPTVDGGPTSDGAPNGDGGPDASAGGTAGSGGGTAGSGASGGSSGSGVGGTSPSGGRGGSAGTASGGTGTTTPPARREDGGCGCRTPGGANGDGLSLAAVAVAIGLTVRRVVRKRERRQ